MQDDYVKFICFALDKIDYKEGIVSISILIKKKIRKANYFIIITLFYFFVLLNRALKEAYEDFYR